MSNPTIIGVTVSVDVSDKSYGTGNSSFMNVQGRYPDPGVPLADVLIDGLDMFLAAWKSLLAGRYATGVVTGAEFKKQLGEAEAKFAKVHKFLQKESEPSVE